MPRPHLTSCAAVLTTRLLDRGETLREAAKSSGLSHDTLALLVRSDRPVTVKVASKLMKYFGDGVVQIHIEPAQA